MRLRPSRRQSGRQRPRIEVRDWNVVAEVPYHADRGVGVGDFEKAALPQLFAIKGQIREWRQIAAYLTTKEAYAHFSRLRSLPGPQRLELWKGKKQMLRWQRPRGAA